MSPGKSKSGLGLELDSLSDSLRNKLACGEDQDKPDFRELDLDSPISPLRTRTGGGLTGTTTTSSSSSSSGSFPLRVSTGTNLDLPTKCDSDPSSHSGELSVESSPSPARKIRHAHSRSESAVFHSPFSSGSGSVTSPAVSVLPAGNICPSGRISGVVNRSSRPDVLGSGSSNYGTGSLMRGCVSPKPNKESGTPCYSRRLLVGADPGKKTAGSSGSDPEDFRRMGNENHKKGNFSEALSFYDKAIAMSPNNPAYRFNRSAALIGLKRLAEAAAECEIAVKLDPRYARARHRLGSLFLSLGQIENARKHICFPGMEQNSTLLHQLQSVEKHLSMCGDARRAGDWRSALKEIDAAIACGVEASPQFWACRVEALLKLHNLDDAVSAFTNVDISEASAGLQSKIFGILSEAYIFFVRSQIELARGRFDDALRDIEKAVQRDPHNPEVSTLRNNVKIVSRARARGNDLFKSGRYTEACSAYAEGLRMDPTNSVLYCNRAACWFMLSQWERCLDDCNQALRVQPHYTKALMRRAAAYSKLERWKEAVRDYEALRKELPNDNEIAESLFHVQVALKKSHGEDVSNLKFGGEVESVSSVEEFRAAISSPCASVVHFKTGSNFECKRISPFLDTLCARYPSVNFLKVDIEEAFAIAQAENVRVVPTFKIYRKGSRVKEMVSPSREVLESSVRHYSSTT